MIRPDAPPDDALAERLTAGLRYLSDALATQDLAAEFDVQNWIVVEQSPAYDRRRASEVMRFLYDEDGAEWRDTFILHVFDKLPRETQLGFGPMHGPVVRREAVLGPHGAALIAHEIAHSWDETHHVGQNLLAQRPWDWEPFVTAASAKRMRAMARGLYGGDLPARFDLYPVLHIAGDYVPPRDGADKAPRRTFLDWFRLAWAGLSNARR